MGVFSQTFAIISKSMIARKNSKKALDISLHAPATFFDQIWPKVNTFDSRGHQRKKYFLTWSWFSMNNFFDNRDTKIKKGTIVFRSSRGFRKCTVWPWKVNLKKMTSGQVRSRSDHYPSISICISFEASWRGKSFGTTCASLAPFYHELLGKTLGDFEWPCLGSPMTSALTSRGYRHMIWQVFARKKQCCDPRAATCHSSRDILEKPFLTEKRYVFFEFFFL